nr:MAG TPA: hypothetical protein [Caudoviricetes sp.]
MLFLAILNQNKAFCVDQYQKAWLSHDTHATNIYINTM